MDIGSRSSTNSLSLFLVLIPVLVNLDMQQQNHQQRFHETHKCSGRLHMGKERNKLLSARHLHTDSCRIQHVYHEGWDTGTNVGRCWWWIWMEVGCPSLPWVVLYYSYQNSPGGFLPLFFWGKIYSDPIPFPYTRDKAIMSVWKQGKGSMSSASPLVHLNLQALPPFCKKNKKIKKSDDLLSTCHDSSPLTMRHVKEGKS